MDHINESILNFSNYENDGSSLIKIIYIFSINFPYIYTTLENKDDKDAYLNKLEIAKKALKKKNNENSLSNFSKNYGDFDYLTNLIDTFLSAGKENKIKSDFIMDLNYLESN